MTNENTPDENSGTPTDLRRNILLVGGLAIVLALFGLGYLILAGRQSDSELSDREERARLAVEEFERTRPTATPLPRGPVPTEAPTGPIGPVPVNGEVIVVNRVPGDDYGRLAIRHTDGSRTLLDRECLRVHVSSGNGVCVADKGGLVPGYTTSFFDLTDDRVPDLKSYDSALPSRVRLSPDGSLSTVTAFVTGTSYEDIGADTTTIVTVDKFQQKIDLRGANQFVVTEGDDSYYVSPDRQFWGITFADNNDFYITGFFGVAPEIMTGRLEDLTVSPTGWIGSCPSLSPDGKTLVYKEARLDGGFDLVAVDLATEDKWNLGETRSVDDQVEWLDNDTILYAIHPEGGDNPVQPEFDIWSLDIAEGSEPEMFLPNADSPAAVR